MVGDADQLLGDFVGGEDEVDRAGGDGRARHAVEARRLVLREGDASLGLDGLGAARAVRRGGDRVVRRRKSIRFTPSGVTTSVIVESGGCTIRPLSINRRFVPLPGPGGIQAD